MKREIPPVWLCSFRQPTPQGLKIVKRAEGSGLPTLSNPCHRACRRGFTLVEILVSVAIIAILAALVLPAFKSMRTHAQAARCVSSIRSWGTAMQLYVQENNGVFPNSKYPTNTHGILAKYLSMPENMTPSQLDQKIGCPDPDWKYGFNSLLSERPISTVSQPSKQIYAMDLCSSANDNRWIDLTVLGSKVVALRNAMPKPHSRKVCVLYVSGGAGLKLVSELYRSEVTRDTPSYVSSDDTTPIGSPDFDR